MSYSDLSFDPVLTAKRDKTEIAPGTWEPAYRFVRGDVAMTPRNLELRCLGSFHLDPTRALASLQRVISIAEEHAAEIFCSHSMPEFATWKKAPEWYE